MSLQVSGLAGQVALSELHAGEDDEALAFTLELEQIGGDNRMVKLVVYPFHDLEMVKRMLLKKLGPAHAGFRISEVEIFYKGTEIPNRRLMIAFADADIVRLSWRIRDRLGRSLTLRGIRERGGLKIHPRHVKLVEQVAVALQCQVNPKLTSEGTGGTYMLYNSAHRPVGVFKPSDEEAFAPNNPRGYLGHFGQRGFRSGVVSGEGATREVAAFLLDAYYGSLSSVPATSLVEMIHPHFCYDPSNPKRMREGDDFVLEGLLRRKKKSNNSGSGPPLRWKVGSLQEFVNAKDSSSDYDPRMFSIGDVHKIAILDIRLANMDRNDGNILVLKSDEAELFNISEDLLHPPFARQNPSYEAAALLTPDGKLTKHRLIPIDHGLTLPDCLDVTDFDLAWLNWPQAHQPLLKEEIDYIDSLRPDSDADWLSTKLEIRSTCLRIMQSTTRLLKKGVQAGLTLHQIAMLMVRTSPDEPSPLEKVVKLAVSQACFAQFATALVHKRDPGLRYVMDLADNTLNRNNTDTTTTVPRAGGRIRWPGHYDDPDTAKSSAGGQETSGGAPRPRSKTIGRIAPSAVVEKTTNRLRNFTAWRTRDPRAETCVSSLWLTKDAGGRVVTPEWDNPKFKRLFFESFENVLDFLIRERFLAKKKSDSTSASRES